MPFDPRTGLPVLQSHETGYLQGSASAAVRLRRCNGITMGEPRLADNGTTTMTDTIYPYGPPVALAPNLFQVTGALKLPVPRNMTIVRNDREELVIYSAIAMHEVGMQALEVLGKPTVMVIPHRRHQMDAPFYKARYPKIRVLAP